MFFKKKSQQPTAVPGVPPEITIFNEIAKTLFFAVNGGNNGATLSAILVFDEQQRLSSADDVTLDGVPKMPSPEVFTAINGVSAQLLNLDHKYLIKGLNIRVAEGRIQVSADYR